MTTLFTIAIIWGMIFSIILIAIGWRLVHAFEGIVQAQAFLANKHGGHGDQEAAWEAEIAGRLARFKAGESAPVAAGDVFARLRPIAPDR